MPEFRAGLAGVVELDRVIVLGDSIDRSAHPFAVAVIESELGHIDARFVTAVQIVHASRRMARQPLLGRVCYSKGEVEDNRDRSGDVRDVLGLDRHVVDRLPVRSASARSKVRCSKSKLASMMRRGTQRRLVSARAGSVRRKRAPTWTSGFGVGGD